MSAEGHRRRLEALGIERYFRFSVNDEVEAKRALSEIRVLQGQLRQIKSEIGADVKTIRADYRDRASEVAREGFGLALLGAKKMAGQHRARKKERLAAERDKVLAPYEGVLLEIGRSLAALDDVKAQLTGYVQKVKAQEKAGKPTSQAKNVCPKCGSAVGKKDPFCRHCGHKLM